MEQPRDWTDNHNWWLYASIANLTLWVGAAFGSVGTMSPPTHVYAVDVVFGIGMVLGLTFVLGYNAGKWQRRKENNV